MTTNFAFLSFAELQKTAVSRAKDDHQLTATEPSSRTEGILSPDKDTDAASTDNFGHYRTVGLTIPRKARLHGRPLLRKELLRPGEGNGLPSARQLHLHTFLELTCKAK
jgi:hypothetical protein